MTRHSLRAIDFIDHMIEAVRRIQLFTDGKTHADFLADIYMQDAVIRNFENLGEAAKNLLAVLPDAPSRFPDIQFSKIYAMRNEVSHGYFVVDFEIIWQAVENRIPNLRGSLEAAAKALQSSQPTP